MSTTTIPLKRIAHLKAGQSPPSDEVEPLAGGFPFLQGNGEFGHVSPNPAYECDTPRKSCQPNDILISVRAPVGALNIADRSYGIGRGLCAIRSRGMDGRFLWWCLHLQVERLNSIATGSTYVAVTAEDIGSIRLPSIDFDEQRHIADFLDAETARIDQLARLCETQIEALDEHLYAQVSEVLVPGCLTAAKNLWPWLWLPDLPEDRPLVRLGYVSRLQNGLTVDASRDMTHDVVTRPYLRVANVQAGHLNMDSVSEITLPRSVAARSTLLSGDVLMTEGGDLDKLGRGTVWRGELADCLHQNHIFAVRPDPDRLDGDYLALVTQSLHGRCYFESTGVKTTNLASTNSNKILSFPVPLPAIERQRELVRYLHTKIATIGRARRTLNRQLALLVERRQALITAAVTGQIDVATAGG